MVTESPSRPLILLLEITYKKGKTKNLNFLPLSRHTSNEKGKAYRISAARRLSAATKERLVDVGALLETYETMSESWRGGYQEGKPT